MRIFTIGFTKKSAEQFFTTLRGSGASVLIDVRLNNVSQLAGFAKRHDLEYLVRALCDMDYRHALTLAPTQEMLDDYRKRDHDWQRYEERFLGLMKDREIETVMSRDAMSNACLLCSEAFPDRCHRRLVAEYLQRQWNNLEVVHL